jgi:hypothetical protein
MSYEERITVYNTRQKQSLVFSSLFVYFPIFVLSLWRKLGRQAVTASSAGVLVAILPKKVKI